MAVMVYALYTYHWRAASIRKGGRGPYDDRVGPVSCYRTVFGLGVAYPVTDYTLYRSARFVFTVHRLNRRTQGHDLQSLSLSTSFCVSPRTTRNPELF